MMQGHQITTHSHHIPPQQQQSYHDIAPTHLPILQDSFPHNSHPSQHIPPYNAPYPHHAEDQAGDVANSSRLQPTSLVQDGRIYSLEVVQQPIRARMCGFGDKDRRPLTPPPCVRLRILDAASGQPIDVSQVDITYFILTVDLWAANGPREANLVRHSATSPSISAATTTSYPPAQDPLSAAWTTHHMPSMNSKLYPFAGDFHHPSSGPSSSAALPTHQENMYAPQFASSGLPKDLNHPMQAAQQYQREQAMHIQNMQQRMQVAGQSSNSIHQTDPTTIHGTNTQEQGLALSNPESSGLGLYPPSNGQSIYDAAASAPIGMVDPRSQPSGMFSRNLIGSLACGACKLRYPEHDLGIWFILQDLSIRTEGNFRLKFSFVDVGAGMRSLQSSLSPPSTFSTQFQSADIKDESGKRANSISDPVSATSTNSSVPGGIGGKKSGTSQTSHSSNSSPTTTTDPSSNGVVQVGTLNNTSTPVLATTYTHEFQVFSAKKFPGVIDSTPLSKAFARQGVKIPVRKDAPSTPGGESGKKGADRRRADDDDEGEREDDDQADDAALVESSFSGRENKKTRK